MSNLDRLLTAKEVTEFLNIDLQRVYDLTRRKLLPTVVLGERQYRYSRQAIEKFIASGGNQKHEKVNSGGINEK
jgi:excisionase family DNA binding protein